jgi:hypothetical protein
VISVLSVEILSRILELIKPGFQGFEFFAGAAQDGGLDVEFLPGDKIQATQAGLQDCLEVVLQVAAQRSDSGGNRRREASGQIIDEAWIHKIYPAR